MKCDIRPGPHDHIWRLIYEYKNSCTYEFTLYVNLSQHISRIYKHVTKLSSSQLNCSVLEATSDCLQHLKTLTPLRKCSSAPVSTCIPTHSGHSTYAPTHSRCSFSSTLPALEVHAIVRVACSVLIQWEYNVNLINVTSANSLPVCQRLVSISIAYSGTDNLLVCQQFTKVSTIY